MLEFKDVRKAFGDREILKGVTFKVERSEIFFILGKSGTGKSVTLRHFMGILKPDSGDVRVDGISVPTLTEDRLLDLRLECGFVFQLPALFDSLNIWDNLAFGLKNPRARKRLGIPSFQDPEVKRRVEECLSAVGLSPEIFPLYPHEISYGMQKRVSMARTLGPGPKILLFDEPTTGLDPLTTDAIGKLIENLSRKFQTTSIVVSHDMGSALKYADRVLFLEGGQVVFEGTPEKMKQAQVPVVQAFLE
jgi:phospholipid/cholesterol/gamma-HCH transport system ATP-binding protein